MAIHLVSVIGKVTMLHQMLRHYGSAGVERMSIHLHLTKSSDPSLSLAMSTLQEFDTAPASINVSQWFTHINHDLISWTRACHPDDWFILADQDELHEYPDDIRSIVNYCDRKGYQYIEGALVDRVAPSGFLEAVTPHTNLGSQFSIGCQLSAVVLKAVVNKIVAVRGAVLLQDGQHRALSGRGCPAESMYVPVHHFKWVEGVYEELTSRLELNRLLRPVAHDLYSAECERFLSYYQLKGKIRLDEESIMAGACDPTYPYWSAIRQARLTAPAFSVELAIADHRSQDLARSSTSSTVS